MRLGTVRLRHGDSVSSVAFLPDSKTLLSAGYDETVRLWDVRTGKERRRLELAELAQVMLSADGKVLVTRRTDEVVQAWDTATGKELFPAKGRKAFGLPTCALSPDGKTLAAFAPDGSIDLWDLASRRKVRSFGGGRAPDVRLRLCALVFSPDGKTLVTLSGDLPVGRDDFTVVVQLWDVAAGKRRHCLDLSLKHSPAALPAFSPDSKLLAWAHGKHVTLLDVGIGKEVRRLTTSRSAGPEDVIFSSDGKTLYSYDRTDGTVRAWTVASGKEQWLAPGPRSPFAGQFSSRHTFRRWLALSANGRLLACAGGGPTVRVLDTATGKDTLSFSGHRGAIFALGYSRDGKTLTTQGEDGRALLWDVAQGTETGRLRAPANVFAWLLAPDGKSFVSEGLDGSLRLWEAATGKERHRLVTGLRASRLWFAITPEWSFAPDGKWLAVRGSVDTTLQLFNVRTGKGVPTFPPPPTVPPAALESPRWPLARPAFSPDGKVLAAPIHDDAVVLWDRASGRELRRLRLPKEQTVICLTFAPDGRSLALDMGYGNVALWEMETGRRRRLYGEPVKEDERLPSFRSVVVFSTDGRTLALATKGKVHVWDVLTGKERGQFRGQQGDVRALAFSPDGSTLASGGADGTALLWDVAGLGKPADRRIK